METLRDIDIVRAAPSGRMTLLRDTPPEDGGTNPDGTTGTGNTLEVRFSVFNTWYPIESWYEGEFIERTLQGAFKRTIKNNGDQVRALYDHGHDPSVGNKVLGPITDLREDPDSPVGVVELFDTSYNADLRPGLLAGVYGSSFRFRVIQDAWNDDPGTSDYNPKGIPERTIKEIRLFEFGPVTFPANPDATAGLRSMTDRYYEELRSRDPHGVDELRTRVIDLRTLRAGTGTADPAPGPASTPPADPIRHSDPATTEPAVTGEPEQAPASPGTAAPHSAQTERSTPVPELDERPMTVAERAARQDEIQARLTAIDNEYAGGALPEDVRSEWNRITAEDAEHEDAIQDANERRKQLTERAARKDSGERVPTFDSKRNGGRGRQAPGVVVQPENVFNLAAIRQQARNVDELPELYRENAMRAVEQAHFASAEVDRSAAQTQVERLLNKVDDKQGTLARRILITGSPTYQRAFGKAAVSGSTDGLTQEERTALAVGVDATGGYAVPFTLDPTVILTSDGSVNPMRQVARVEQIVTKAWHGVTSAGVTVTRAAEAAEVGDNSPTLAGPIVTPTRVQGFVQFSDEVEMDWNSLSSEITMMLQDAKDQEEAASFITGDGNAPNAAGVIATLAGGSAVGQTGAAGAFTVPADLYALEQAVPPRFRQRAVWIANKSTYNKIRLAAQSEAGLAGDLWVRFSGGQPPELLGYAAYEASAMDSTIEAHGGLANLILALGDFKRGFIIVDRVGMNVELVPHIFGANRRPTGQRGLFAIWRNGSKVLVDNAIRVLNVVSAA